MADNTSTNNGVIASDGVTYSGDANVAVQLFRPVLTTGSEGSRTVVDLPGDATNGLDVDVTRLPGSVVSTVNSSTATLTSGSTFTGTSEDVKDYASIQIAIIASHASATDGLSIEQSTDGTNWDIIDTYTIPAATGKTFSVQIAARYLRIRYTNGGTNQTYFRLQTVYHYNQTKPSSQRASDAYSNENDLTQMWAFMSVWNGSTWDRAAGNTSGQFAQGNIAHDGIDGGNPVKVGMRALAHGTNPTAVAAADRVDWLANRAGIPFVMGGHPNIVTLEYATTGSQTDVAIITVGAGTKIVVTQIQVVTDNANTAFPQLRVGFGTANTPTTTGVVLTHPGLPAGGGVSRGDGSGILGIGADNEDLRITCGAPTGGSIRVLVSYYTIES